MRQAIATVKKTKEIQEKYKVFTKKSFGQNFIIEPGIVEKIANAAIQSRDELVFEIGPGIGALTQFLCEKSNQVVAFEIDERLPVVLENEIGFDHLQIVLEDILKVDIDEKIPHMGWNQLHITNHQPILKYVHENDDVYFVHSYMAHCKDENLVAYTDYGTTKVTALVQNKNVIGCQFHPEKSGMVGHKILLAFKEMVEC